MAELFKFRCYQCEKLLGVPPRKAGRTVHCPRCGIELIVPSTTEDESIEASDDSDEPGQALEDLGINLGFDLSLGLRPEERPGGRATPRPADRPADQLEAIAFLERSSFTEPSTTRDEAANPPATHDPDSPPDEGGVEDEDPIVRAVNEPLLPRSPKRRPSQPAFDRRRDVVLPRTAVVAWALFALLALGFSFASGLLIGHYRWK